MFPPHIIDIYIIDDLVKVTILLNTNPKETLFLFELIVLLFIFIKSITYYINETKVNRIFYSNCINFISYKIDIIVNDFF